MRTGEGFLAIWSDVAPDDETDYLHWLTREHVAERLTVDGFLAARVYRSHRTDVARYFIHYDLRSPEALAGPSYLARLNDPTPWSRRIMPRLGAFARGGGRVAAHGGEGAGGWRAVVRLAEPPVAVEPLVRELASADRIAAAALLVTDTTRTAISTREKSLRPHDETFPGLLVIDGLDEAAVAAAVQRVGVAGGVGLYRLVFAR
jgi:hypothetical protein